MFGIPGSEGIDGCERIPDANTFLCSDTHTGAQGANENHTERLTKSTRDVVRSPLKCLSVCVCALYGIGICNCVYV